MAAGSPHLSRRAPPRLGRRRARGRRNVRNRAVPLFLAVARAAEIRLRARRQHHRRRADFRRSRQRGRLAESGDFPARQKRAPGIRRRRPAGLFLRGRAALGQPALRLERARAHALRLVAAPPARQLRALRHRPSRPFPRILRLLAHPGGFADGENRALGARPRTRLLQNRAEDARERAAHRRRPRRHERRRPRASRRNGASRHGRAAVRFRRRRLERATTSAATCGATGKPRTGP